MSTLHSTNALLLIGHGTRDDRGQREFVETARMVGERLPDVVTEPCFLEHAEPSISESIEALVERGVERIVGVPLLLLAAAHAKRDIPQILGHAAEQYRDVAFTLAEHLGCHESVVLASERRFEEADVSSTGEASGTLPEPTTLLLVGRGSSDEDATTEMLQFSAARRERNSRLHIETAFLAMAEPSASEVIDRLSSSPARSVIVQPHLLFHGRLVDRLRELVETARARSPSQEWRLAGYFGPMPEIVDAVVDRFTQAVSGQPDW